MVTSPIRNDAKEKQFQETCKAIASAWKQILELWKEWNDIKTTRPKLYSGLLLSILLVLAWIGNLFNNVSPHLVGNQLTVSQLQLFLTYLIVLFVALYPGLKTHGIIEQYMGKAIKSIKEKIGDKLKQN